MRDYDYDIYAEEMDYREKEWDEPGPEFGHIIRTNRVTGEFDIFPPEDV